MTESQIFLMTQNFIETKPAVALALKELKMGTSLSLNLEDREDCHCFFDQKSVQLKPGKGENSDVLFKINAEAVRRLSSLPCETLSETGIEIVREVLTGNIKIQLLSKPQNILTNGYLKIITAAGPDFLNFLAQHGLKNIFKIISFIKSMKP
jgi:hypothetical protein